MPVLGAFLGMALMAACTPARLPLALHGASEGDSMVAVGVVRASLRAGDTWLEVRLRNTGRSPIMVAWGEAEFVSPDGVRHGLVDGSVLAALLRSRREATSREWAEWGGPDRRRGGSGGREDRAEHRAPDWIEPGSTWSVGPGKAVEWILYPVEHLSMDDVGNLLIGSLFHDHETSGARSLTVMVPVRVGGRWSQVALEARALAGGSSPCCRRRVNALVLHP